MANKSEKNKKQEEINQDQAREDQQVSDIEEQEEEPKEENVDEATEQEVETAESKVSRLENELEASKDKYLRLFSEFENFKKRTTREKSELIDTANEKLITDLLPVIDDFERSLGHIKENETEGPLLEGVELVYNKFIKVLTDKGLKPMDIAPGSEFDSEYQEAVAQTPAPEEGLQGKVVDVVEKGYFLGDKVIRFAKVVTGT